MPAFQWNFIQSSQQGRSELRSSTNWSRYNIPPSAFLVESPLCWELINSEMSKSKNVRPWCEKGIKGDYTLDLGFKRCQGTRLRVGRMLNNDLYLFLWHLVFSALTESITSGFHNTLSRRYSREILRTLKNIFLKVTGLAGRQCRIWNLEAMPVSLFRASYSVLFPL